MFTWNFLELFANDNQLVSVRYLLTGIDGELTVKSEGIHTFQDKTVNKALVDVVESDLVQWIEKDTTINGVNLIKLAIENQLKSLEATKKVDFPWLVNTFTME